jgi:hypothetical protein
MLLELERISVPPGQKIVLEKITWQEFETILDELGEHRSTRIAYDNGILEIMTPLPEHETEWMQRIYRRWQAATWGKISVLVFIVLSVITLSEFELPHGELGALFSGEILPILNILVAVKVALGSWAVILVFIRYRGLL